MEGWAVSTAKGREERTSEGFEISRLELVTLAFGDEGELTRNYDGFKLVGGGLVVRHGRTCGRHRVNSTFSRRVLLDFVRWRYIQVNWSEDLGFLHDGLFF